MNSIRRITFVEAPIAASAIFGIAALAVVLLGVTQATSAARDGAARSILARAETLPRGVERDAALASALIVIEDAVAAAPKDAGAHARAARLYYLQATTAAVDDVSAPLLEAAGRAIKEARARSPRNASVDALSALIDISRSGGAVSETASAAVARSYAAPASREGAVWRLEAAARAWGALPVALQQRVIVDGCAQATSDPAFAQALAAVANDMPDSGIGTCAAAPVRPDAPL